MEDWKGGVRRLEYVLPAGADPLRVGTALGRMGLSGTVIRRVKWLEDGILVDGARVTTRTLLHPGQTLSVRLSDPSPRSGVRPVEGPLDIRYEDGDLVVLEKPPGLLVHPSHGHFDDTLGNFLMYHYKMTGAEGDFHPVHRLDKGTSGLLVVAKHPFAQEKLKGQLHTPLFRRVYLAVCDGVPDPPAGVVDAPIGMAEGSLVARRVRPDGRPARTGYRVLSAAGGRALVRLELETGRTHQIRVHMAHLGCPLTGDFLYGREDPALIARPALHSASLSFRHPVTGDPLQFTSPLPADMRALAGD